MRFANFLEGGCVFLSWSLGLGGIEKTTCWILRLACLDYLHALLFLKLKIGSCSV